MFRKIAIIVVAALAILGFQGSAFANGLGTVDEAKAMVEKAAKLIEADGKEKAFAAFNDANGGFVDRDLYVFVLNMDGVVVSHGAIKALIGRSVADLKDVDGKPFIREMLAMGKDAGSGWVDCKWTNPISKKIELKANYIKRVGDVIIAVGAYKG
ncbi:MAG: cache domain-containing protein [Proteobacteria bacterium]|nr:cache domain-containing protein [Pseudomonadota bacterium]